MARQQRLGLRNWMRCMPAERIFSRLSTGRALRNVSLLLALVAIISMPFSDLVIVATDPWPELGRIALGMITPYWGEPLTLLQALGQTVAFALLALVLSVPLGLLLAFGFHWRPVRMLAAAVRSVHEIFWGLLFMQMFGLSALTGLLAIAVPYTGVFARVFAEIFARQSPHAGQSIAPQASHISRIFYTRFWQGYRDILNYSRYRFECALRSSAILGFIGLPTLGFHLETAFKQGQYSEAAALLWVFFLLIASIRLWLHRRLIPVYSLVALWLLPETPAMNSSYLWQFISTDIWPRTLQQGEWLGALHWYQQVFMQEALPALGQTLMLTQLALVLTGIIALLIYPMASRTLAGPLRPAGRLALLMMRSTPELMIAFVLLLLFGPSGLPAVLALAVHNGGLIGFLLANACEQQPKRPDDPRGLAGYLYLHTPRLYPSFLAFLFYRWEVMMRESAMMGVLGIATLGFFIDSAFEEIRYDKALFLIIVAAALNIALDSLARRLRRWAGVEQTPGLS